MEKHKHETDSEHTTDSSIPTKFPTKKPKLSTDRYSPDYGESKLFVGAYKPDHESDNSLRRAVYITYDKHGNDVYELRGNGSDYQGRLWLKSPKKIKPRDVQWLEEFDIKDKHERGSKIFNAMITKGLTQHWGWGSYTHMVNDPGFRLEYERRQQLMRDGRYWAPSFEVSRWAPEHEFDYQQGFVLQVLDTLDRMSAQAKKVAGDVLDSEDFAARQKTCQELYTAVRRQTDILTDLLDTDRLMWTDVVDTKVNYSLQL